MFCLVFSLGGGRMDSPGKCVGVCVCVSVWGREKEIMICAVEILTAMHYILQGTVHSIAPIQPKSRNLETSCTLSLWISVKQTETLWLWRSSVSSEQWTHSCRRSIYRKWWPMPTHKFLLCWVMKMAVMFELFEIFFFYSKGFFFHRTRWQIQAMGSTSFPRYLACGEEFGEEAATGKQCSYIRWVSC